MNPWEIFDRTSPHVERRENITTVDVSVVVPTYNGAQYLAAALDSIGQQTMRPREVIVVDDGSTDGSPEIAEQMGARVIRLSRSGVCVARNRGITEATSSWIALLDQDDLWLPTKLERQCNAAALHTDAVLIATDAAKVDGNNHLVLASFIHADFMHYNRVQPTSRENGIDYFASGQDALRYAGWFLLPSAVLARRDALVASGMFDERITLHEDVSCFTRVLANGALVVIHEALTGWRIHSSNTHFNTLAMLRGALSLTRIAVLEPQAYPYWFVKKHTDALPGLLLEIGRAEMAVNNASAARAALSEAISRGAGSRAGLLWLMSHLGANNFERLASLSRGFRSKKPTT